VPATALAMLAMLKATWIGLGQLLGFK